MIANRIIDIAGQDSSSLHILKDYLQNSPNPDIIRFIAYHPRSIPLLKELICNLLFVDSDHFFVEHTHTCLSDKNAFMSNVILNAQSIWQNYYYDYSWNDETSKILRIYEERKDQTQNLDLWKQMIATFSTDIANSVTDPPKKEESSESFEFTFNPPQFNFGAFKLPSFNEQAPKSTMFTLEPSNIQSAPPAPKNEYLDPLKPFEEVHNINDKKKTLEQQSRTFANQLSGVSFNFSFGQSSSAFKLQDEAQKVEETPQYNFQFSSCISSKKN